MTTATFQPLTWLCWWRLTRWMVGIIRVYPPGSCIDPAPYKFFTVASITGCVAEINGLSHADITKQDLRAMAAAIKPYGVKIVRWHHNLKNHTFNIR